MGIQFDDEVAGGRKHRGIAAFVVVSLVFVIVGGLIYSNTLNSPFLFDDYQNIRDNPHIRLKQLDFKGIIEAGFKSHAWRRPIAYISFALNYYFHQYNVSGYHFTNISIHILTGIFFYLLAKNTLSAARGGLRHKDCGAMAFFAAILWLAHPIQTQSVTYIVQRMASLGTMFYILSFLLYVNGRIARLEQKKSRYWFAGCVLSGMLAFGCKEITATLPAFILLYEWYFFQDLSAAWLKKKLVHIIGVFTIFCILGLVYLGTSPLEKIQLAYARRDFTMTERLLTQSRVVIYYIGLLAYPHPGRLNLDHDFPISQSLFDPATTLLCIGVILGLIGLAVYLAKRERLLSFCILWFFGNLAIESSVIGLEIMFEHRLYLPSTFVSMLVVTFVWRFIKQYRVKVTILCILALLFSVWTYERNKVYADPVTLWQDCVDKSPQKARPHGSLGRFLRERGKATEAAAHLRKSLELEPDSARIHNDLGNALRQLGKVDEAIWHYQKALSLKSNFAEAHYNLAIVLAEKGKIDEAISEYQWSLKLKPENVDALNNLGFLFAKEGKNVEAAGYYRKAIELAPENAIAHGRLGIVLAEQGKTDEAIEEIRIVLELRPGDVEMHCNLGILLEKQGRTSEAIEQYQEALVINPNYLKAQNLLKAASLKQQNR